MCCSLDIWLDAWETYSYCSNGLNNEAWNWLHASMKIQIADIFFMFSKKDIHGFPRSPMHTNFVLHIIQVEPLPIQKKKKNACWTLEIVVNHFMQLFISMVDGGLQN